MEISLELEIYKEGSKTLLEISEEGTTGSTYSIKTIRDAGEALMNYLENTIGEEQ